MIQLKKIVLPQLLFHEDINYTNVRRALDYIGRLIGIEFDYTEESHMSFIEGRCAIAKAKRKEYYNS